MPKLKIVPTKKRGRNGDDGRRQTARVPMTREPTLSESSDEDTEPNTSQEQEQKPSTSRMAGPSSQSQQNGRKSKAKTKPKRSARKNQLDDDDEYDEANDFNRTQNAGNSTEQLISNCLSYLLIANTKQHAIKRADISKNVLKGVNLGPLEYKKLLKKVQKQLKSVFGIQLYGINESTHDFGYDLSVVGLNSFMLVSDFKPILHTANIVHLTNYEETVRSVLFISLSLLFMNSVDPTVGLKEEAIWRFVEKLQIDTQLGNIKQQDFTKFLKAELVQKLYLTARETRDDGQEVTAVRYFWGPRSHLEYSKADILIKMAQFLKAKPRDFPDQYRSVLNSEEGGQAEALFAQFEERQAREEEDDAYIDTDAETVDFDTDAEQEVTANDRRTIRIPSANTDQDAIDSSEIDTQDLSSLTPVANGNLNVDTDSIDTSEIDTQELFAPTGQNAAANDGSETDYSSD